MFIKLQNSNQTIKHEQQQIIFKHFYLLYEFKVLENVSYSLCFTDLVY